ncbi:hypothetical protein DA102_033730 [Sinorhizobium meliloti]|nr:hypothetical protein DA102_033730 [Sinorhizobium meliloti]
MVVRTWRFADERSFPPSEPFPGNNREAAQGAEQARAADIRQGYVHDPVLEAANVRYVAGDITTEEFREEMLARFKRA